MKRIQRYLAIFLAGLVLGSPGFAAEEKEQLSLEEVMKDITTVSKNVKSLKMRANMGMEAQGSLLTGTMQIWFKAPGKMRMVNEFMGITSTTIMDGKLLWVEAQTPMGLQVMKMDLTAAEEGAGGMPGAMGGLGQADFLFANTFKEESKAFDFTVEGKEQLEGEEVYVISGKAKDPLPDPSLELLAGSTKKVWIGVKDGITRKMDVSGAKGMGGDISIVYADIELNPTIEESRFSYTPPPGVQVIDMAEMMR